MVNGDEDYKNVFFRGEEYAENVELTCISRLFSNYLFKLHHENRINTIDHGCIYYVFCAAFCIPYILRTF